jgi:NADPH:quinone reductase-like Zn-dependent oxidoreductase
MKAVLLHEYGAPSKLKYEDAPDPVAGPGEVLVRVAAASINPIDWKVRSGEAKQWFPLEFPAILGYDLSGIVRAVGEGANGFAPGDRVMAFTKETYAELAVVKSSELSHVPEKLDLVEAAALPLVTQTGEQLITQGTRIQKGQTVLITGAVGGVGRSAVLTAKKAGAIVIAGVKKSQRKQAESLGVDQIIALDDKDDLAKLGFLDAVADTVNGETAQLLLGKVKQGGTFASVLGPPANATMHPTVHVVPIYAQPNAAKLREMAEDVVAGRLLIPIDRMIPLSDAAAGHAAAEKGGIGKVLLLA